MTPPVNVTGNPENPRPRRQVCAVPTCKYLAQTDGRCWQHRANIQKLRAVARLASGMPLNDVASELGMPISAVADLAVQVRDLEGG